MPQLADSIIDHYERHAEDWDADRNRHIDPWVDKPWHDRFVAALPAGGSVPQVGEHGLAEL